MRHARAMTRRSQVEIPADLRARLEAARLDLLALFRALDRMALAPAEMPQRLIRQIFELDADYAEALWALDQPPGTLDLNLMLRDTLASLEQFPEASRRCKELSNQSLRNLSGPQRHSIQATEQCQQIEPCRFQTGAEISRNL